MEAEAKYDFQATSADELDFRKGNKLKVLNMEDENWFKAEMNGREGFIPSNYIEMKPHDWFVAKISRTDAETKLLGAGMQDGAFLIRPRGDGAQGEFSLSVKFANQCQHFKVLRDAGGQYYIWEVKFDSLNALVKFHRTASVSRTQSIFLRDMTSAPPVVQEKVIANYDFKPGDKEELEMRRGDIVIVTDKSDNDWWMGEIHRGAQVTKGLFPRTYVSSYKE